jgi:FkbM family methyltransferase
MKVYEKFDEVRFFDEICSIHNTYLSLRNDGVPFPAESVAFWTGLLALQNLAGITGDMLELGLEHGGTAFLSVCALRDGEQQVLIDLKRSERFEEKYVLLPEKKATAIQFYETGTQSPPTNELSNRNYRFIHIDAGHTYEAVKADMIRYAGLLKEGGILCCDDFFTIRWPDVTIAVLETFELHNLVPLFLVNRKIYFCRLLDYPQWKDCFDKNVNLFDTFGVFKIWDTLMKGYSTITGQIVPKAYVGRQMIDESQRPKWHEEKHNETMEMRNVEELSREFDDDALRSVPLNKREPITNLLEDTFELIIDIIRPHVICEIGAYEADFSLRMKQKYGHSRVVAYEGNPRVYEHFQEKIRANGVDYIHVAIDASSGEVEFSIPEIIAGKDMPFACRMGSLLEVQLRDSSTLQVKVPSCRLDDALNIDAGQDCILWIDVEGAVERVLEGGAETLKACKVIFCELERSPVWKDQSLDNAIISRLSEQGFRLIARDCQKWFQYNAIFVRNEILQDKAIQDIVSNYFDQALKLWKANHKFELMQFWDKPEPPFEVETLMMSWCNDNTFQYHKFDAKLAHSFIKQYFDQRTLKAFEACAIPAMQADFFRLCWLYENSGIYIDADIGNLKDNALFTRRDIRAYLFIRHNNIANDLMMFNNRHDPLLSLALDTAIKNIEARLDADVWTVTGPKILTNIYYEKTPEHSLFKDIIIDKVENLREHVLFNWDLEYKKGPEHWTNANAKQFWHYALHERFD